MSETRIVHTDGPSLLFHHGDAYPRKCRKGETLRTLEDGTLVEVVDMAEKKYNGFFHWLKVKAPSGDLGWIAEVYARRVD